MFPRTGGVATPRTPQQAEGQVAHQPPGTEVQLGFERISVIRRREDSSEFRQHPFYSGVRHVYDGRSKYLIHVERIAPPECTTLPMVGIGATDRLVDVLYGSRPVNIPEMYQSVEQVPGGVSMHTIVQIDPEDTDPSIRPTTEDAHFWVFNEETIGTSRTLVEYIDAESNFRLSNSEGIMPFQTGKHFIPKGSTDVKMSVWISGWAVHVKAPLDMEKVILKASMNNGICHIKLARGM